MKIEISETLETPDAERVLRVLEGCLRQMSGEVSSEVVRSDRQIVLHGLGPSPVSVNRRDVTVLRIRPIDGKTLIEGEANFQASSLLGGSSQDEAVRSKLELVFDRVKTQLWSEASKAGAPVIGRSAPAPAIAGISGVEAAVAGDAAGGKMRMAEAANDADIPLLRTLADFGEEKDSPRRVRWIGVVLGLLAVAFVGGFLLLGKAGMSSWFARVATEVRSVGAPKATLEPERQARADNGPSSVAGGVSAPVAAVPLGSAVGASAPDVSGSKASDGNASEGNVSGPGTSELRAWLEQWAAAMRTRDAALQARYYSNPVERYLGRGEVTRAMVQKDREATIAMRKGLWTVRIERIVVERQGPAEAQVRLVKHFIDRQQDGEVLESDVPTRLILKRVGSGWRISSEEELRILG